MKAKSQTLKSAEDLFKYRTVVDKAVPQRGGTKDYMPDGSWLQGKRLEKFHQEREAVLSEPRVQRIVDLVKGEWKPDKQLIEFEKEMRNFWEHMGFVDKQRKWLHPEEALFLMETNVLEVWYGGIPLSIQQAYSMFLGENFSLEYYQVYSHLRRIGYVVLRHRRSHVTKYERQINLDTYLSKRERKRALKAEKNMAKHLEDVSHSPAKRRELESDQDDTAEDTSIGVDEDEEPLPSLVAQESWNEAEGSGREEVVTEIGENSELRSNKSEQNNRDLLNKCEEQWKVNEIVLEKHMEYTAVQKFDAQYTELDNTDSGHANEGESMEFDNPKESDEVQCNYNTDQSRTEGGKENMFKGDILRHSNNNHRDQSEIEKVGIFQGLVSDFSDLHVWKIDNASASRTHNYNVTNWNFDEINFPDFGTGIGEKTVEIRRPDGKFLPGHFDLAQENYCFDRKVMINKKATKSLHEQFDWNEETLDFSYPDIMTDYVNVKKSCRNWTEYKNCQYHASASWDRSHDLPHLYGDKVGPVVLPEDAASTSAVLDKLHIIQEEQRKINSPIPRGSGDQKLVFDVYAPNIKFRKSAPGTPEHRVCVARCSDPFPNLLQVSELTQQLQDDVPVLLALVDSGDVAFYELNDLMLPLDITIG